MGSQRITSKVSNSGIFAVSPVKDTLQAKYATFTTKIKERFDTLGVTYNGIQQNGGLVSGNPVTTASSYFYHSDHLGSSSIITDGTGALVQHVEYVPFGETFIDERNGNWHTPYLFNGKERDEETGLYYYHARYYDSKRSVWLSVDPLKGKNLNVSAYVYCYNNPVKYIDPDGKFSSEFRSNLHRFFHGGNKNSKSYKSENGVWGYNKPYIGNYLTEGGAIFIDGKNRNNSTTGKPRESLQKGGFGLLGSSSTQENNLPKAKHYYGTLDIKGLLFPFANPSLPSFELFDLAKMVAFTTDYIDSSNKGAGVELNNAPEIEEPYPIVISYSDKWLKNISGFKSNTVYDTVYNKEQYDSVINIANSTKLQDTGIYEKRLSETYFEPTK